MDAKVFHHGDPVIKAGGDPRSAVAADPRSIIRTLGKAPACARHTVASTLSVMIY
jgi:hypothetical protein